MLFRMVGEHRPGKALQSTDPYTERRNITKNNIETALNTIPANRSITTLFSLFVKSSQS